MNLDEKFERWSDRINPIVVKELRQTVRSGVLLSSLLAVAGVVMLALFLQLGMRDLAVAPGQPVGRNIFQLLGQLLFLFCLIIIPVNAAARMIQERDRHNVDLIYASLISPGAIVRGKLAVGGYQVFLFFMICAPFLFVTSLLRGIDLLSITAVLLIGFVLIMVELQVAIFVGSLNSARAVRVILGVIGAALTLPLLLLVFDGCMRVIAGQGVKGGFRLVFSKNGFVLLLIAGPIIGALYALSAALVGRHCGPWIAPTSGSVKAPEGDGNRL